MKRRILTVLAILLISVLLFVAYLVVTLRPIPANVTYGATFSTMHAESLELNWRTAYLAMLDELKVRNIRIPAYWPRVEPERGVFAWNELDFQLSEAKARGADVVLAIGRRLPRWPECHIPQWAWSLSWEEQKAELREYITAVVERYKGNSAITHWQIENEPYLKAFAFEHCRELDEAFLKEEIALVRSLDSRPACTCTFGIRSSGNSRPSFRRSCTA